MKKTSIACSGILTILILSITLLSGCYYSIGSTFSQSSGKIDGSYVTFNGETHKSIKLNEGQTLVLDYTATIKKGTLHLSVTSPNKETLWEVTLDKDNKDMVEIHAEKAGNYKINMKGDKTGGGYHIKISKK